MRMIKSFMYDEFELFFEIWILDFYNKEDGYECVECYLYRREFLFICKFEVR